MAIAPKSPLTPLEDPLQDREIFASEVTGVGSVHGNIAVTLATIRFDEPVAGDAPRAHRIITARLILTNPAAGQLLQSLQRLAAQIQAAQATATGKEPN